MHIHAHAHTRREDKYGGRETERRPLYLRWSPWILRAEDPPFVSLPPFHLPPTPVPPLSPLPSFAVLLGIESLRLGFLVPLSPPPPFRIARGKKPASSLSLSASARPWGRRRAGRRVAAVDEGGWGERVIFFRGHRGGGWMIFATISLGKSIPTPGSQAGRLTPLCDLASAARNTE